MNYLTTIGDQEFNIEVLDKGRVSVNGKVMQVDFESISGQPVYSLLIDGKSYEAFVNAAEDEWQVLLLGQQYPVRVEDAREKRLRAAAGGMAHGTGEFQLKAPMPGLVVSIPVEENQEVEKGQVLIVLESMKMQNELRSPRAGKVQRIKAKAGESVEQRQVLLTVG
jgi:biotin carboxyl carrier protein